MDGWISVETKKPKETGLYLACSMIPERDDFRQIGEHYDENVRITGAQIKDLLCSYDAEKKLWQHLTGFYDHAITHWMDKVSPPETKQ